MPEGDTLHRAAKTLHLALAGKRVVGFESEIATVRTAAQNKPLVGETVVGVSAVGKHLLMELSNGVTLRTHMRMNGSWHIYRRGERWKRPRSSMRIVLQTEDLEAVAFDVPAAELVTAKQLARGDVGKLGPDVLGETFDVDAAIARLRALGPQPIGELLLNQRVAAGIGNIWKSESLYRCGVRPDRRGPDVSDAELREIFAAARKLMSASVRGSRPRFEVYEREGEPCRKCDTPIAYFKQGLGARATYFCPSCQT